MKLFLTFIKAHWGLFTLVIFVAITVLSLYPLESTPSVPGSDKTHHLIAYALLMFPVALRRPDNWIFFGLLFVGYSGAIELIQPYVNRYGEWMDMLANTAGIICGIFLAKLLNYFFIQ